MPSESIYVEKNTLVVLIQEADVCLRCLVGGKRQDYEYNSFIFMICKGMSSDLLTAKQLLCCL